MEDRAEALLDRLADCSLAGGVTEEDLCGRAVREPFRRMCAGLVAQVQRVAQATPEVDARNLTGAVKAVRRNCSEESNAEGGRLDRSLIRVLRAVEPKSKVMDRLTALEGIVDYFQAAVMVLVASEVPEGEEVGEAMEVDISAREKSALVRKLCSTLNVTCSGKCEEALGQCQSRAQGLYACPMPGPSGGPLLDKQSLSTGQLKTLREIYGALFSEYRIRRETLSKRAAVCLQSLQYSKRVEDSRDDLSGIISAAVTKMSANPAVEIDDIFQVVKGDLIELQSRVTKGEGGEFQASVKNVLMGSVPDRGGRVSDRRMPKGDMPKWTARKEGGGGGQDVGKGKKWTGEKKSKHHHHRHGRKQKN